MATTNLLNGLHGVMLDMYGVISALLDLGPPGYESFSSNATWLEKRSLNC